ncbi:exported hypothetical protein [Vibrio chagasii]|nr:exported hypothetical protein [Vibrio chagasii]
MKKTLLCMALATPIVAVAQDDKSHIQHFPLGTSFDESSHVLTIFDSSIEVSNFEASDAGFSFNLKDYDDLAEVQGSINYLSVGEVSDAKVTVSFMENKATIETELVAEHGTVSSQIKLTASDTYNIKEAFPHDEFSSKDFIKEIKNIGITQESKNTSGELLEDLNQHMETSNCKIGDNGIQTSANVSITGDFSQILKSKTGRDMLGSIDSASVALGFHADSIAAYGGQIGSEDGILAISHYYTPQCESFDAKQNQEALNTVQMGAAMIPIIAADTPHLGKLGFDTAAYFLEIMTNPNKPHMADMEVPLDVVLEEVSTLMTPRTLEEELIETEEHLVE